LVSSPWPLNQCNLSLSTMSGDLCRDFENGKCTRGERCRFFHPKLQICKDFQNKTCERDRCKFLHVTREEEETYENSGVFPDHIDKEEGKRKRIMEPDFGGGRYGKRLRDDVFYPMVAATPASPALMQDNKMLKAKVTDLQRQVVELRQMNDTLYEQNTLYRNQLRGLTTTTNVTSVGVRDLVGNRDYYDFSTVAR